MNKERLVNKGGATFCQFPNANTASPSFPEAVLSRVNLYSENANTATTPQYLSLLLEYYDQTAYCKHNTDSTL